MKPIPIVIDCDPGIDDSFAIALAHATPGYEIKAITAVEGNVPAAVTRKNTLSVAELFDIDCRVAFGAEFPLEKPYLKNGAAVHGISGLGTVSLPAPTRKPDEKAAWDVIYEEAVKAEGSLILFALGPLTNIATALRVHPDLPKYLHKFCIMGGGTFGNIEESGCTAEFNIWVDPTAAREVFEKLEVYMVGLNSTHSAALTPAELDEMIRICAAAPTPQTSFLEGLTEFSKKNSMEHGQDNHIIHDALAIASLLDPSPVRFADCHVEIETSSEAINNGQTILDFENKDGKRINCHAAMQVDRPRFAALMQEMCRYYCDIHLN